MAGVFAKKVWKPFGFVVAFGVVLAACSDKKESVLVQNILPTKYKNEILLAFPQVVADPTNIRDAAITDPALNQTGPIRVYYVCVRANARDAAHQYTGVKTYAGYFYDGHLGQLVDAPAGLCDKAVYRPFPELEKLCLGNVCK